jgi:hypothetical protein
MDWILVFRVSFVGFLVCLALITFVVIPRAGSIPRVYGFVLWYSFIFFDVLLIASFFFIPDINQVIGGE